MYVGISSFAFGNSNKLEQPAFAYESQECQLPTRPAWQCGEFGKLLLFVRVETQEAQMGKRTAKS
jgi:hypothetical protein